MVVLGAGGAATAIQVQCALDGAESISIFNPKDPFFARAESTAEKLSKETPDCKVSVFDLADEAKLKEEVANADILVNATLAGMKPHEELTLIKDKSMFRPDLVVADVVYNPAETRMVKEAKEAGCKLAIGGKGMLLWQGAAAYKLYTGLEMPTAEYQKFQEEISAAVRFRPVPPAFREIQNTCVLSVLKFSTICARFSLLVEPVSI